MDRLLDAHEVPALPPDAGPRGEIAVGYEQQREVIELAFGHRIALIASALGAPPAWMIEQGRTGRTTCSCPRCQGGEATTSRPAP